MPSVIAWEFYSGIGGLHLALRRSTIDGHVARAFDWDQTARQVYAANFGPDIVTKVDIASLSASALDAEDRPAELWLLSPSCQPYTVLNPNAQGSADPRAKSFLHLIETVLPELVTSGSVATPKRLLIENVAGFETSSTRQVLVSTLHCLGYNIMEFLLTPLQFGIPNSRLRYYLLASTTPFGQDVSKSAARIWRHIPGQGRQDWVDPRALATQTDDSAASYESDISPIAGFLDHDVQLNNLCAVPDRVLLKWGRLFDIVLPSSRRSCCFTRGYTQLVERSGSILQMNEDLDTTSVFEAFCRAQMSGDSNALEILRPLGLRYFSPSELLRIFHFLPPNSNSSDNTQDSFTWPESLSVKSKYRLIGNSVNVLVVTALIDFLFSQ